MTDLLADASQMRRHLSPLTSPIPGAESLLELTDDRLEERWARAVWTSLAEPGDGTAGALIEALGAGAALRLAGQHPPFERARGRAAEPTAAASAAAEAADVHVRYVMEGLERWRPRCVGSAVSAMFSTAERAGLRFVVPGDLAWPAALDDLGVHRPAGLWVRGDLSALTSSTPAIAVVGARAATNYGEHVAMELSAELVGGGARIISGAAYGIDGAAHRAALASGGRTIAILAGGADRAYPSGHSDLLDRIAERGAVISEVAPGGAPTRWRFLQRNRLIAAVADATVVVEAGWRSGSLNTAGHAAALGRPLGAVPGPITSAASAGCHRLLRESDASCITSAGDVWELAGIDRSGRAGRNPGGVAEALFDEAEVSGLSQRRRPGRADRTDDSTRLSDALSTRSWRTPLDIAQRSGMSIPEVEALLALEHLEGTVERSDDGWRSVSLARRSGRSGSRGPVR